MTSSRKTSEKYAKALFSKSTSSDELLMESHALNALKQEMKHSETAHFFQNPFVTIEKKMDILTKSLGNTVTPKLLRFLELIIKNKRVQDIPSISLEFQALVNESQDSMSAVLIFAENLDDETKAFFKTKLETIFNKKVKITEKIDPSIIGGFILITAGRIIDLSIKGKLSSIKERMHSVNM